MSRLWRPRSLRGQAWGAPAIPMQRLPQADICEGRDYFRIQQAAAAALVQSHVSGDPIEEGNLQHRVGASARRHPDDGLDDETQARSGHDRAKQRQASEWRRANGRRLYGGERSGKPGRGAAGKTPFIAAVATTEDGKPDQIIVRRVIGFRKVAIGKLASTALRRCPLTIAAKSWLLG